MPIENLVIYFWLPIIVIFRNVSARLLGRQTSVRAEIQAIIAAARRAHDAGVDNLVVFTDSHHAYDCYHKWDDRWERNGWFKADGTKVRNWEDLSSMEYYMGLFDNIRLVSQYAINLKTASWVLYVIF